MPECSECGEPLEDPEDKNNAGHWRDKHIGCMDSPDVDRDTPIHETDEYQDWLENRDGN